MKRRSKKPVWCLFKVTEMLFSLSCCLVHWRCFRHHGVPHVFILCGVYGGSIIMGILSMIGSFYAEKPRMKYEAGHAGVLGAFHLLTVFAHMMMAKMDRFYTKTWAGFYNCSRDNAMVALFAGAIYLLHLTFALDLMISHQRHTRKHPDRSRRALSLYFISPGVEDYVSRFRWFQHLSNKIISSNQPSEHSAKTRNMSFDSESDEDKRVTVDEKPVDETGWGALRGSYVRNDLA